MGAFEALQILEASITGYINSQIPIRIIILLTGICGILYLRLKMNQVRSETLAISQNRERLDNLISDIDHRANSVFRLMSTSLKRYHPHDMQIENVNLYKMLDKVSSGDRSSSSLFSYRLGHYNAEKYYICKEFLNQLLENKNITSKKKIYLMIDSGSTVYPIFKFLCDYYWANHRRDVLEKIEIFTNNIPGFVYLASYGRIGDDITADMIYKCNVIPGTVEGKYNAVLGEDSITHTHFMINRIKESDPNNCAFISVLTGNYISTIDGVLWRGDFHGAMKDTLIELSDFIYILSPLGKFVDVCAEDLNNIIQKSPLKLSGKKSYKSLYDLGKEKYLIKINDCNENLSATCRLLPRNLVQNKKDNIYLFTTNRVSRKGSIYPNELNVYFNHIITELKVCFRNKNIYISNFYPGIDSEEVIYKLAFYVDQRDEVFYSYEFPHPEFKAYIENRINPIEAVDT